jgi:hypothetical protein
LAVAGEYTVELPLCPSLPAAITIWHSVFASFEIECNVSERGKNEFKAATSIRENIHQEVSMQVCKGVSFH